MQLLPFYARSQRPSFLARSTSASPEGIILPAAMSAIAFSRLIFDHMLREPRGVNLWSHHASSSFPFWPSIQPQARATSSAAA